MNMSAQGDRHVLWQVGGTDDVGAEAEGEVAGTAGRTLNTLMKAQHAHIRRCVLASRSGEHLRKPTTNIVRVREPDERHADTAGVEHNAERSVEHMQALMDR